MNNLQIAQKCNSEYVYEDGSLLKMLPRGIAMNPEVAEIEEGVVAIVPMEIELADGDTGNPYQKTKVKGRQGPETEGALKYPYRRR